MSVEIGGFPASLVHETAKISRAIYPGPTNHKLLKLLGEPITSQRFVHGSFGRGYCRIMINDKAVVVAFRGTRENVDWYIANLRALPVRLRDCGLVTSVLVHKGFQKALDFRDKTSGMRSFDAILSLLDEIDVGRRDLYITGHSLGGAIAVLFAAKLRHHRENLVKKNLRGIITFGAPASGLSGFHHFYGDLHGLTLRLVNASDAVPYSPPIGYRHVGRSLWIRNGSIEADPGWLPRLRLSLGLVSPLSFIADHSMAHYIAGLSGAIGNKPG
jgi:pimeloyl-ACP methyl ester carboxylesterase